MILKKFKSFLAIILVATFIMPQSILAYSDYIIAGGENIGLQVKNKGLIVAGFYKVSNIYPAKDALLEKGDTIVKADDKTIESIDDFVNAVKDSNQRNIKISYIRNNKDNVTTLNLINDKGVLKTGLYVKDMVSGIGTLTYIDPKTKLYGALGHEIIESSSGMKINVKDGKIYDSKVTSIDKSIRGEPGAKNANINSNIVFGDIKENTQNGVFGNYISKINDNKLYKVADYKDINLGNAKIITVINDNQKREYNINIIKVSNNKNDNKNILFEITDEELMNKTGGIVQGMSGSPIIQDNKIIGAVTHVIVDNCKKGYGIFITNMLEEAEN